MNDVFCQLPVAHNSCNRIDSDLHYPHKPFALNIAYYYMDYHQMGDYLICQVTICIEIVVLVNIARAASADVTCVIN